MHPATIRVLKIELASLVIAITVAAPILTPFCAVRAADSHADKRPYKSPTHVDLSKIPLSKMQRYSEPNNFERDERRVFELQAMGRWRSARELMDELKTFSPEELVAVKLMSEHKSQRAYEIMRDKVRLYERIRGPICGNIGRTISRAKETLKNIEKFRVEPNSVSSSKH